MTKTTILAVTVIAFAFGACSRSSTRNEQTTSMKDTTSFHSIDTTKLATGTVFYQCPMNPEEISEKPDVCPKCGMELEKVEKR